MPGRVPFSSGSGGKPVTGQAYVQTFATADRTHAARTSLAVATTGASNVTPFGFTTAAQANAIVTAINALRDDLADTAALLNALIDDLQSVGVVN